MAKEWVEEVGRRNRTSKTKRLHMDGQPTNTFCQDLSTAPVHYKDTADEWQDIQTDLVPSTESIVGFGDAAYEMIENDYEMFVLDYLRSGDPIIHCRGKLDGYYVEFCAQDLNWRNDLDDLEYIGTPSETLTEVSESRADWPDTYGSGIHLRYLAGLSRMVKLVILDAPLPPPAQYIIHGGNPTLEFVERFEFHKDLEVWINGELWDEKTDVVTAAPIEFRSPDGQVRFYVPIPRALDSRTDFETDEFPHGTMHLKKSGNKLLIGVRFPYSWLESAIYPVYLDGTLDKQVAASADDRCGTASAWETVDNAQVQCLRGGSGNEVDVGCRFIGVDIPNGATISAAYSEVWVSSFDDPYCQIHCEDAAAPPDFSDGQAYIRSRTATTNYGVWQAEGVGVDQWIQTPTGELIDPIQEVVTDYTCTVINLLWIADTGTPLRKIVFRTYDYTGNAHGAKLHVEYTAGGQEYDETGKLITLLSVLSKSDSMTAYEKDRALTALAVLSKTEAYTMGETGRELTLLGQLSSSDTATFTDSATVTPLAVLGQTDIMQMLETGISQTVLAQLSKSDAVTRDEAERLLTVLVQVSGADQFVYIETGLLLSLLAQLSSSDVATFTDSASVVPLAVLTPSDVMQMVETAKLQTVLAELSKTDSMANMETGRSLTALAQASGVDAMTVFEKDRLLTLLAELSKTDTLAAYEKNLVTIILSQTTKSDVMSIYEEDKLLTLLAQLFHADAATRLETGKLQTVLAQLSQTDAYTMGEVGKLATLLAQVTGADVAMFTDSGLISVLALVSKSDIQTMAETGKALTVLGVLSSADVYTMGETGKQTLVLIALSQSDLQTMVESRILIPLAVVTGHDEYFPISEPEGAGIWLDDSWGWRRSG